jgi:hypothetical protein
MPDPAQLRIIEQSPDHMVAYDPPYVVFGVAFTAFAVVVVLLMIFVTWKTGWRAVYLVGFLVAIILALIGIGVGTTASYIRADRTGNVAVEKTVFGAPFAGPSYPARDVTEAKVETSKNLRRVVLILRNGEVIAITSATDRSGYDDVARAINQVLRQ